MQTLFSCRGECCVQKSCADGTDASIPPYAVQLPLAIATVEWQVGSDELTLESFTSRTLSGVHSLKSPWVESLFPRNMCLAETSGCERGFGEEVDLEHSMASPNPCYASGCS